MPAYPGAIPAKPTIVATDMSAVTTHATDRGLLWDELVAIAQTAGTTPAGADSTVKARLDRIEATLVSNAIKCVEFTPVGFNDASVEAMVDWVTLGNLTVPTWATAAIVQMNVVGLYAVTAVPTNLKLRTSIGAVNGSTLGRVDGYTLNQRNNSAWADRINSIATGVQALKVQAQRDSAQGAIRADTVSAFSAIVTYL